MIRLYDEKMYLLDNSRIVSISEYAKENPDKKFRTEEHKKGTISYNILQSHNTSKDDKKLKIKFDALTSHDITYVSIIQTAKASGMTEFPIPYVLTNCHNSLCAVGGTINSDDHMFGFSAAKKYGGIYVPAHLAVIHQYMREMMAACGKMILGSDSHTRYGALGTMAIGEGGGELVKQLLSESYEIDYPEIIGIYLTGKLRAGVGPHDVALAIIGKVFKNGYVKNKVMEFIGDGIFQLDADFRSGIDVMTTETTCLTSIWQTDEKTKEFFKIHNRESDYKELKPQDIALYDGMVYVDLSEIKPMIALPFHPSNVYTIDELNENLKDILASVDKETEALLGKNNFSLLNKVENGKLKVDQGIIAGCAGGTYTNIMQASHILKFMENSACSNYSKDYSDAAFSFSVYPSSQAVYMELVKNGTLANLVSNGAFIKTAFCGPCFGAGDTPSHNALSIRHTTRNFPSREGSKSSNGQISYVALMDSRSIAATVANHGILTSAENIVKEKEIEESSITSYSFDESIYKKKVYNGFGKKDANAEIVYGPNIKDWPKISPLSEHVLLKVCSKIMDSVTTTDELIPSGETSSYRSNPLALAEFTLSRRDPEYVARAKQIHQAELARIHGNDIFSMDLTLKNAYDILKSMESFKELDIKEIEIGSMIYAIKPGDGSAREQASSCQRILGGLANIVKEYATKRYRSNLINWGILPLQMKEDVCFEVGDYIFIPHIRTTIDNSTFSSIKAYVLKENKAKEIDLSFADMTEKEKAILKAGCLINYNKK